MDKEDNKKTDRVHSLKGRLFYSMGAIPSSLPYQMIGSFIAIYYEITLGLSVELFGLLWLLYGVWNAINDPLMGYFMDKYNTKWGRRVPYIIVGTIPFTVGFMLLWWVPWTDQVGMFTHALISLFIFDLGFTIAMTAWTALYTEMYEDEKERATTVAIKDGFAFIAGMIGVLIPSMIAGSIGWPITGIIFGSFIPLTMYLSLLGTKERKEYQIDKPLPIIAAFKETFSNKPFVIVTLTYAILDFMTNLTMMVLPFYAFFVLGVPIGMMGVAAAGIALGLVSGIPFWRWIYANKGPKFGLSLGIAIFTAGIWPIFLAEDFIVLIFLTIIPGFGTAGMLMTEPAVSAAIDYDEIKTGKRREATYSGIFGFVARLALVIMALTMTSIQLLTGFESGSETQSETAIFGLRLLVGVVPVFGGLAALLVFNFFPLNHVEFLKQQEKLKELHESRKLEVDKSVITSKSN